MKARYAALLAIIAGPAVRSDAQTLDRSRRPVPPPPATVVAPPVVADSLPNGLRLFVVEDHSIPVVAVRVLVGADSAVDPAGKDGLARVMLEAMREGAASRSAAELAESAAALGTSISPSAFTTTSDFFAPALALMRDMLMHPSFDSAGIERRKAQQVARARGLAQAPSTTGRRLFYTFNLGAGDPLVRTFSANAAAAASITRADVVRMYEQFIGPRTTSIVVVGDVTARSARQEVERLFGSWSSAATRENVRTPTPSRRNTTIYLVDTPGPNAYVAIGSVGPTRAAEDLPAAEIIASVAAARLGRELRDKRSIVYSPASGLIWRPGGLPAVYVSSAIVPNDKIDTALVAWIGLLRSPIVGAELNAGMQRSSGQVVARLDGADSLAALVVESVRDSVPFDHVARYARRLSTMTEGDVASAAHAYVDPEHLVIVVSGERKAIEPALRAANIAPVVVVDATGKPIP
jgi:zinc protease